MKTKALVLDLDDTLIDTKVRHYRLVQNYIKEFNISFLSFKDYLEIRKEDQLSNFAIIKKLYSNINESFEEFWNCNVEAKKYLLYDNEIVSTELLKEIKKKRNYTLILLSLRSNVNAANEQFRSFSFAKYFDNIFFVNHAANNPKAVLLQKLQEQFESIIFIGDTDADAHAADISQVTFYGVATGIYKLHISNIFTDINHLLLTLLE